MSGPVEVLGTREVTALSTVDSPMVFMVKSLLLPIIPVATLFVCLWAADEPLRGAYFLIAVLTFLGASDVLGVARVAAREERRPALSVFAMLSVRWLALVALIGIVV
jgi:hypothetical protein